MFVKLKPSKICSSRFRVVSSLGPVESKPCHKNCRVTSSHKPASSHGPKTNSAGYGGK